MHLLNHSMLKSNSLERISEELLTRSFSYSALRTYMHIPTKKLLTPSLPWTSESIPDNKTGCHPAKAVYCPTAVRNAHNRPEEKIPIPEPTALRMSKAIHLFSGCSGNCWHKISDIRKVFPNKKIYWPCRYLLVDPNVTIKPTTKKKYFHIYFFLKPQIKHDFHEYKNSPLLKTSLLYLQ